MNPIHFEANAENKNSSGQQSEKDNSYNPNNDFVCNLSYTPKDDGSYSCISSLGSTADKKQPVNLKPKKIIALLLLVAIIASSFGFLGAGIAMKLAEIIKDPYSSDYPYPEDATFTVVGDRPKVETSIVSPSERDKLSISGVTSAVISSTVQILTETVSYSSLFGEYIKEGAGSGVIISENGYIVTNLHVIENSRAIKVILENGNTYQATVIGADSDTDIAVLSISANEKLSPVIFGNSQDLSHGEEVVVIGNPLGSLGGSVTNGIISALERTVTIEDKVMMLIQTNATVNPGNSGGGMFNMFGELVGIVNAKSAGNNIEGIGFAIPVNSVINVSKQIIENGYVKGKIDHGLTLIEVEDVWDMTRYNVPTTGMYIYKSEFLDKLQSGDRINTLNGIKISNTTDFRKALINCKVGDTVKIKVQRGAKELTFDLTLREYVPKNQKTN